MPTNQLKGGGGAFSTRRLDVVPPDFLSYKKRAENMLFWVLLSQNSTAMCPFSAVLVCFPRFLNYTPCRENLVNFQKILELECTFGNIAACNFTKSKLHHRLLRLFQNFQKNNISEYLRTAANFGPSPNATKNVWSKIFHATLQSSKICYGAQLFLPNNL